MRNKLNVFFCGGFVLTLTLISCGCGSSAGTVNPPPPIPQQTEFLYTVAISGAPPSPPSFQFLSFKFDTSSGKLTNTSVMPWTQNNPWIAVDPLSKFLYSSSPNSVANSIVIYTIDSKSGTVTQTGNFVLNSTGICIGCPPPDGPGALALSLDGKLLFYGSSTFGTAQQIGALTVNASSGQLSAAVPGSPFSQTDMPFWVTMHPSNRFLYTQNMDASISSLSTKSISGYSVDSSTGALTPVPGSPFPAPSNATLIGLAIHPSGKFAYFATGLALSGIAGWSIDTSSGVLSPLPGSPFFAGSPFFSGTFDLDGKFFYTSAGASGGIAGFSVDINSGTLTPLPGSPFAAGSTLVQTKVDPSGHFLFAGSTNNSIVTFELESQTGALTQLGSIATPGHPTFLVAAALP